ncbi:MAG: 4'-phosphopantetheinyl transferase superfamily protein [Clostridium sp.]|nr:4'-phosphopantetheinyl transferase superfamily protein [Acetatifactor muris]MCM1527056.1 4'-phosphopantetheinyl transferase superfamily protein [Bacteroides sp.]MCM1562032.1 4'-phosphopantetheinyl transferase superfamily protein [Clostridium sp.]
MPDAGYLLSIEELVADMRANETCSLWEQVFAKLDKERQKRARMHRTAAKRAGTAGAGLLLQWAIQHWQTDEPDRGREIRLLSLREILDGLGDPVPLQYDYGPKGKPYLRDMPLFFNLSHSGDYVLCALSHREIGADIQRWEKCNTEKLAERFFHERERECLRRIPANREREQYFYRLWTAKEAYGKMTGDGIAASVGRDFTDPNAEWMRDLELMEYDILPDYAMAVCTHKEL